jgi:hypothetical protein
VSSREEIKAAALRFVECINAGDSKRLVSMQTEDFTMIDMAGDVFVGRDGWEGYFEPYPVYKIHPQKILVSGNSVAIVGKTTGSHVESKVEVLETILWVAEIRDGLVAKWHIFGDVEETKEYLKSE